MIARLLLTSLAFAAPVAAASAQDRVINAKPCSLLCKVQRNFTRNAAVSATAPLDGRPIAVERAPAAADGVGHPNPSVIFARRGSVMVESPAERAALRRMKARMAREIEGPAAQPVVTLPATPQLGEPGKP